MLKLNKFYGFKGGFLRLINVIGKNSDGLAMVQTYLVRGISLTFGTQQ